MTEDNNDDNLINSICSAGPVADLSVATIRANLRDEKAESLLGRSRKRLLKMSNCRSKYPKQHSSSRLMNKLRVHFSRN